METSVEVVDLKVDSGIENKVDSSEFKETMSKFTYVGDFISTLRKTSNVGATVYLIANIIFLWLFISVAMDDGYGGTNLTLYNLVIVLIMYGISMSIALSSVGEWMLRVHLGCKKIKRREILQRLEPLFMDVHKKAMELQPNIPKDVNLYISNSMEPNAFATGRKTICVTKGLLQLEDEEIKAVLAHEFGHLGNKDTDLLLVISIGNFVVTALFMIFTFIIRIFSSDEDYGGLISIMCIPMMIFMWLWTKIGTALLYSSSRANEYEADEFAFNIGYGYYLARALDKLSCGEGARGGFLNAIYSTHPETDDRIAKLQQLGVNY